MAVYWDTSNVQKLYCNEEDDGAKYNSSWGC